MNFFKNPTPIQIFAEFTDSVFRVRGPVSFETPLERDQQGGLTEACHEKCNERLLRSIETQGVTYDILCSIPLRGVALRRIHLPKVSVEEIPGLLEFQIEKEFPLSLDELSWLSCPSEGQGVMETNGGFDFSVFGIRRSVLRNYQAVFKNLTSQVSWTLSQLSRSLAMELGNSSSEGLLFHIGQHYSEWIRLQKGAPIQSGYLTHGFANGLGAESKIFKDIQSLVGFGTSAPQIQAPVVITTDPSGRSEAVILEESLKSISISASCFGQNASESNLGVGGSLALQGLESKSAQDLGRFDFDEISSEQKAAPKKEFTKWAACAAGLVLLSISMKYAQPIFNYGSLQKRFNEVKAEQKALPDIRKELSFLQLLESNRSPYLESIHIISRTAPQGALIERVGMNRRGEVNLEGQVQSPDQLEEFRSSLIKSGFFYPVVVDEQSMNQQQRKLSFRITAKWKPKDVRQPLPKEWMQVDAGQENASSSSQSNSQGAPERRRR